MHKRFTKNTKTFHRQDVGDDDAGEDFAGYDFTGYDFAFAGADADAGDDFAGYDFAFAGYDFAGYDFAGLRLRRRTTSSEYNLAGYVFAGYDFADVVSEITDYEINARLRGEELKSTPTRRQRWATRTAKARHLPRPRARVM